LTRVNGFGVVVDMSMEIAANWDVVRWVWWKFAGVSEEVTASIFTEQENKHDLSFRTE
jgi:hypothetical protein